jgi:hypothetical protein
VAFMGMAPFGSLLAGGIASSIGAPMTVVICGGLCIAGSLWFASQLPSIRAHARPIYVRMGILPEMALGIQQASSLQTPPED